MTALVLAESLVHALQAVLRILLRHTILLVLCNAALEACNGGCLGLDRRNVHHGASWHLLLVDALLATCIATRVHRRASHLLRVVRTERGGSDTAFRVVSRVETTACTTSEWAS